jgi:hypothetical protein
MMKLTREEIKALANGMPPSVQADYSEIITELAKRIISGDMIPIPVSERLPSSGEQVLSFYDGEWYLDYYTHWNGPNNPPDFDAESGDWHPTHWLPVPPAPESDPPDNSKVNPPDDDATRKVYDDLDKHLPHGGSIGRWNDRKPGEPQ